MKTTKLIIEYDNVNPNYCKYGNIECRYFKYDPEYDYSMCCISYVDKRILYNERLFSTQTRIVPKPAVCSINCSDNKYTVKIKKVLNNGIR